MSAPAIVVLGMHRSGTSAVAGMLAAAGVASAGQGAGQAVRNWDNARGHHEMLELVRLDEAVLAHSGGHYLSPPAEVRWTAEHAAIRDRLLSSQVDGVPALLKDPRMLLVLPFWRASAVPFRTIGVVRHPLAVARSLAAWRELPIAEGLALWQAHNRALLADRAQHDYPIVDFERSADDVITRVAAFAGADRDRIAAAYEPNLVHHDAGGDAPTGLADAISLWTELVPGSEVDRGTAFPRADLTAFTETLATARTPAELASALGHARAALATIADAAAVLVPVVTALVRAKGLDAATALIDETVRLDRGLAELLHGKVSLAAGDPVAAVRHLEAACAVPAPFFAARHLLPQALREAGRRDDARMALQQVAGEALYPHGPLSTLAEWSWLDGDRERALEELANAIAAAPLHRRGRLRTRRAEWLISRGEPDEARAELEQAIAEDPGYPRSREVLAGLARSR